jgi:uncharacterized membrane protein YhaH (DUF805 family)
MSFGTAIKDGFSQYVVWKGRSSRSAFWFWVLFIFLGGIVAGIVDQVVGVSVYSIEPTTFGDGVDVSYAQVGIISSLWSLAIFLPTIAVTVRRLHDTNHSGWWWWLQLLNFLCFIGTIILILAFWIKPSDEAENTYGPPPAA